MPGKSPVILILGAGPNIGQAVARTFASEGYKVALAARSLKEEDSTDAQLNIKADFSKPEEVVDIFTKVRKALGIPSVVVYNGKSSRPKTPFEHLLNPHSWSLGNLPSQRSLRDRVVWLQSRHGSQYHQRLCRCSRSHTWLQGTSCRCSKVILLHGEHPER